jgi:hypothetical protein
MEHISNELQDSLYTGTRGCYELLIHARITFPVDYKADPQHPTTMNTLVCKDLMCVQSDCLFMELYMDCKADSSHVL